MEKLADISSFESLGNGSGFCSSNTVFTRNGLYDSYTAYFGKKEGIPLEVNHRLSTAKFAIKRAQIALGATNKGPMNFSGDWSMVKREVEEAISNLSDALSFMH